MQLVTTVKRKVFYFSVSFIWFKSIFLYPKWRKLLQNMSSAIVIISALRVKFLKQVLDIGQV